MTTTCFCTDAVLNGTALAYILTLTTKNEDDVSICVRHEIDKEAELFAADWAEIRSKLPFPEHLDALLNQRYGTFTYDSAARRWRQ